MSQPLYLVSEDSDDPCIFLCTFDQLSGTMGNIQASLEDNGHTVLNATWRVHLGHDVFAFTLAEKENGVPIMNYWHVRLVRVNDKNPFFIFTPPTTNE